MNITSNFFTRLSAHLEAHAYTRGRFKGDAPADRWKRRMNHFRIIRRGDTLRVRFWADDIVTVFPDGSFAVNLEGFEGRPTTRKALNYALGAARLGEFGMRITTVRPHGMKTTAIRDTAGNTYRYYDGMTFSPAGVLTSEPKPYEGRRIDADESRELREGLKASGFKAMFPMLVAGLGDAPPNYPDYLSALDCSSWTNTSANLRDALTDPDRAESWPTIVSYHGFDYAYDRHRNIEYLPREPKRIWSRIMAICKDDMREIYLTKTYKV